MFGEDDFGSLIFADESGLSDSDYACRTVNHMDDTWDVKEKPRGTVHNCEDK